MSKRIRTVRVRRGFTILELLIVVTMIGLLGAISFGKTSTIMTSWRVNRAAQAMAEELQVAFALVGRNRKPVIVEFRKDSMNLIIRSRSDGVNGTTVFRKRHFGLSSEYKLDSADLKFMRPAPLTITPYSSILEVYPPGLAADSFSVLISKLGAVRRVRLMRGGLTQICTTSDTRRC